MNELLDEENSGEFQGVTLHEVLWSSHESVGRGTGYLFRVAADRIWRVETRVLSNSSSRHIEFRVQRVLVLRTGTPQNRLLITFVQ